MSSYVLVDFKTMGLWRWSSFSFHFSGKVFHSMMEHDSRDSFPFRHMSISDVRDGCWANAVWITAAVPFNLKKVFSGVQVWATGQSSSSKPDTVNHVYGLQCVLSQ